MFLGQFAVGLAAKRATPALWLMVLFGWWVDRHREPAGGKAS